MEQLTIFDVFKDLDKENIIPGIIERFSNQKLSYSRHDKSFIDPSKIVAIYIPEKETSDITPSIATLEDGSYYKYEISHGNFVEITMPLNFNWKPGYYWTWL